MLALLGEHQTNAEIAARLYISERTVEAHVSSLHRKLGAVDRRELSRRRLPGAAGEDAAPLPAALALLADAATFVGRTAEREALRERWQLACAGHTLTAFVTGEAGMGKSRLVAELAAEAHAEGGHVLLGACYEDVDEPYGPFTQAIVADAARLGAVEARRRAAEAGDAVALLSPELAGLVGPAAGGPAAGQAGTAVRDEVLDGIRRWLDASAAGHRCSSSSRTSTGRPPRPGTPCATSCAGPGDRRCSWSSPPATPSRISTPTWQRCWPTSNGRPR